MRQNVFLISGSGINLVVKLEHCISDHREPSVFKDIISTAALIV